MNQMRAFLLRYRVMAFAVITMALAMKALVPTGYMIGTDSRVLSIRICDDAQVTAALHAKDIAIPMKGEPAGKHAKGDGACPYSALSFASLGGADPIQLALALLFILAAGFTPLMLPARRRAAHLRPPLRGPPTLI
jgi:hypothetical protein